MDTQIIIYSTLLMSGASIAIGVGLGLAAKKFKIKSDPRKDEIALLLPGVNCGACGFVGCEQYAVALTTENVDTSLCKVGGQDVVSKIAKILGKESSDVVRKIAVVMCVGGTKCKDDFVYSGIKKCSYANNFVEGQKMCKYGCLGFGDCVSVCPFDAIHINKIGVAEVDILKCTGCGLCVKSCPKKIIKLVPCVYKVHIKCTSQDRGNFVRQVCSVGCIACGICIKICSVKDIYLDKNLAFMKYEKCNNCQLCATKCPTKCIIVENLTTTTTEQLRLNSGK